MTQAESLERRTAHSIAWRAGTNLAAVVVLFGRAVILARLLEVSTFGTYALAFAIVCQGASTDVPGFASSPWFET